MSGANTIVPFLDVAAKRASEMMEQKRREAVEGAPSADQNVEAVENILRAMEGMQAQLQALIDLVIEQDKRIEKLEKAKPGRIIAAR